MVILVQDQIGNLWSWTNTTVLNVRGMKSWYGSRTSGGWGSRNQICFKKRHNWFMDVIVRMIALRGSYCGLEYVIFPGKARKTLQLLFAFWCLKGAGREIISAFSNARLPVEAEERHDGLDWTLELSQRLRTCCRNQRARVTELCYNFCCNVSFWP